MLPSVDGRMKNQLSCVVAIVLKMTTWFALEPFNVLIYDIVKTWGTQKLNAMWNHADKFLYVLTENH